MKGWVLLVSAVLHLAALAALLPWPAGGDQADEVPPVEVELIQQREATMGGAPAIEAAPTPEVAPATETAADPADSPRLPTPPTPPGAEATPRPERRPDTPPTDAPRPSPSRPAPAPRSAAAVRLGDADEARAGMDVTARNIVPASPDSAFRNQPPVYPEQAARIGAEGTVGLVVQVSAQGIPIKVTVANSSGTASLDREAQNAIRRWRFTPARIRGKPVPFDYALDIRFILGDRQ